MKEIPRWQQGFRPAAFGDVWDKSSPRERRRMFVQDIITVVVCVLLLAGIIHFV